MHVFFPFYKEHFQRHYTNTVVCNVAMCYIKDLLFHTCSRTSTLYTLSLSRGVDSLVSVHSDALRVEVWRHEGRSTAVCMAGAKCWALHVAEVWILRSSDRVSRSIVNATESFRKDYNRVMHWLNNTVTSSRDSLFLYLIMFIGLALY